MRRLHLFSDSLSLPNDRARADTTLKCAILLNLLEEEFLVLLENLVRPSGDCFFDN